LVEVPDAYLPPKAGNPIAVLHTLRSASDSSSSGELIDSLKFEPGDQYAAMIDAFGRSVTAGELVDPAENGFEQMKVLDQIRESRGS
jgi:hypothetical protein